MNKPKVLAILGPTAVGKTRLTLELAAALPIEVISLDSAQVYRGMDIGTAKPSPAERAAAPHHLIDTRDFWDTYSAADFAVDASALVREITARERLPVLSGGTLLYLKALREGLSNLPGADPTVRDRIDAQARALGWPALHKRLMEIDPDTAHRLAPGDAQRIQRALEVFEITGQPLSQLQGERSGGLDADWRLLTLVPADRSALHGRIARRLDEMFSQGLMDEVRKLHGHRNYRRDLPALRAVGYRQVLDYLEGDLGADDVRDRALFATRQLAKRQLTWLRGLAADWIMDPLQDPDSRPVTSAIQRWIDS